MSKRKRAEPSANDAIVQNLAGRCKCPISGSLFVDPVLALDGFTYERAAIARWFVSRQTSPMTRAVLESRALIAHVAMQQIVEELVSSPTLPVEERVEWHISRGKLRAAASQNDHGAAAEAVRLFERAVELSNTEASAEASAAALAEYRKHAQLCLELCAHVERTRELQQRAVAEGVGVDWLGPAMYGGSQPNDASGLFPQDVRPQFLFEYRGLAMGSLIRVGGSQDSLVAACNRAAACHPDDPTAAADVGYSAQKSAMLGRQFVVLEGDRLDKTYRVCPRESRPVACFFVASRALAICHRSADARNTSGTFCVRPRREMAYSNTSRAKSGYRSKLSSFSV